METLLTESTLEDHMMIVTDVRLMFIMSSLNLLQLPNSVRQVFEDYSWESSILYRPMFTSQEVEILGLNQFLLAIRHAHLRSETMLLLHHQSFDFSLSFGSHDISN